jgi:hypothetical protein
MNLKSFAILSAVIALSGCTLPKSPIINPTPDSSGITGNWEITLTSTTYGGEYPFGIYLTQTGSTVSGVGSWVGEAFPLCIASTGPPCGYPYSMLSPNFSGTIGTDGSLVLTSPSSGSYPITITINASTTNNTTLSGTFAITTQTTTTDKGPVTGTMIAPLDGTYAGTLISSVTGNNIGVTTTLSQSGPVSGSYLEYSGSASFTGVYCIGSVTVPASGNFFGNRLIIDLYPANIPQSGIYMTGTISPDAKTIAVNYESVSSSCSADFASGTLTLQ